MEKYGDWFTHDKTPRANIMAREQGNVSHPEYCHNDDAIPVVNHSLRFPRVVLIPGTVLPGAVQCSTYQYTVHSTVHNIFNKYVFATIIH